MRLALAFIAWIFAAAPSYAGLTKAQFAEVRIDAPQNAAFSLDLAFKTSEGENETLGDALAGKPALIVFADYTCHTLCGPAIEMASAALAQSGLKPGRDYRLIAIGIDPKDPLSAAAAMKQRAVDDPDVEAASVFLTGEDTAIGAAARAVGYHFVYDAEHDQFAHPAAAFVVTAAGRVSQILTPIGLPPETVRAALQNAYEGKIGSPGSFLGLHCYGFDPLFGLYNASVTLWLQIGGATLCVFLALGFVIMIRRQARQRTEPAS